MESNQHGQVKPLVSVCVIAYQLERYIGEAIESIMMQQTTFPVQLVIGEDLSKDRTREICEQYAVKYGERIKLLPSDKHYGVQYNYFRTLKECSGKYVAMCDGDDFWTDPYKLQKHVDFLEQNSGCALTFHPVNILNESNGSLNKEVESHEIIMYDWKELFHLFIPTPSVVFRNCIESFPKEFFVENFPDIFLFGIISCYGGAADLGFVGATYRKHSIGLYSGLKKIQQFRKIILTRRLMHDSSFFNSEQKKEIKKEIKRKKLIYVKNFIKHKDLLNCIIILFT